MAEQKDQAQAQTNAPLTSPTTTPAPTPATTPAPTTAQAAKAATTPAPAAATTPAVTTPAAVVAVKYPANASFDFSKGDEGWGGVGQTDGLQPGVAVAPDDNYKLDGHTSLKFTPQTSGKLYGVGVSQPTKVSKITLYVFIPLDKADRDVQVGLFYLDQKYGWHDDGFGGKIVPGRWNQFSLSVAEDQPIQQFGLKLVGYSGSIYINGVTVEP